jgi:serine/threonine protein kinase
MDEELKHLHEQLIQARRPEDIFGSEDVVLPEQMWLDYLSAQYQKQKAVVNPTQYSNPLDKELAEEASSLLQRLYEQGKERVRKNFYGIGVGSRARPAKASKSFTIGKNTYYIGNKIWHEELTTLYEGFLECDRCAIGDVVIKIANNEDANSFIQAETRNLDILHDNQVPQWKHLPFILDRFQSRGRIGIVQRKISGVVLSAVRSHRLHKDGLDEKHMVWVLDRLLSLLGYVHSCGMVHGNIDPDRIILQPTHHNAILVGWSAAVFEPAKTGERVNSPASNFMAPEVKEKGEIGPWSDIYSLGKTMQWLLGGDPSEETFPSAVNPAIAKFVKKLIQTDYRRRPADAWQLYDEQSALKDSLWPRKFLHLDLS